jgi:hypothetical protein
MYADRPAANEALQASSQMYVTWQLSLSFPDLKKHPDQHLCPQLQGFFDKKFVEEELNYKLVSNASLLIGMHPDQATEIIIDMALQFQRPFAVIPCCVFPREFPDRKTKEGKDVIEYP